MASSNEGNPNNVDDQLASQRYVTVMLRLVLDRANRIVQGELVDLEGTSLGRFATCRGLVRAMRRWLALPHGDSSP